MNSTEAPTSSPESTPTPAGPAAAARATKDAAVSLVDALFDLGEAWAVYGLRAVRRALDSAARGLSRAARVVEATATRLEKPAAA
jgi:hypothetical protein